MKMNKNLGILLVIILVISSPILTCYADGLIFSDGFETGDVLSWDEQYYGSVTTTAYQGDYGFYSNRSTSVVTKFIDDVEIVHMRWYVMFNSFPQPNIYASIGGIQDVPYTSDFAFVGIYRDGVGVIQWYCHVSGSQVAYSETPPLNEWICLEFRYDVVHGIHKVWRNGELIITVNQASVPLAGKLVIGIWNGAWVDDIQVFSDCVVASDSYIGVIPTDTATKGFVFGSSILVIFIAAPIGIILFALVMKKRRR